MEATDTEPGKRNGAIAGRLGQPRDASQIFGEARFSASEPGFAGGIVRAPAIGSSGRRQALPVNPKPSVMR